MCVQTPASLFKKQSICIHNMRCPISHIPYSDLEYPVFIGKTTNILYELQYLAEWYRQSKTDPCTRRVISWNNIRPACHSKENKTKILDRIVHEMYMPVTTVATHHHSVVLVQIMESRRQFVEGFERAFVVQQNGTLKCDKVIRPFVQEWYNANLDFIADVIDFTPPALRLEEPKPVRDNATTNQNKVEMIRAYCFALLAYHSTCKKLQRHFNELYTPLLIVGEDDP